LGSEGRDSLRQIYYRRVYQKCRDHRTYCFVPQGGSVCRGWLKASHRAIDQNKSKPYQPFHPHTESITIKPNEIVEYAIEIRETSYVFKAGHSLQLIIKREDSPYEDPLWFHLPNMRETRHTLYHNSKDVSYLLLPIIPA
jgi:predicted acyl esterase